MLCLFSGLFIFKLSIDGVFLLWQNTHAFYRADRLQAYGSVGLATSALLGDHRHTPSPELFHVPAAGRRPAPPRPLASTAPPFSVDPGTLGPHRTGTVRFLSFCDWLSVVCSGSFHVVAGVRVSFLFKAA